MPSSISISGHLISSFVSFTTIFHLGLFLYLSVYMGLYYAAMLKHANSFPTLVISINAFFAASHVFSTGISPSDSWNNQVHALSSPLLARSHLDRPLLSYSAGHAILIILLYIYHVSIQAVLHLYPAL